MGKFIVPAIVGNSARRATSSLWAICAVAIIALPGAACASTLSDSVAQALDSHPAIVAKKAVVDAADQNVREQRSAFFPQFSAGARAGRLAQEDDITREFTSGLATSWLTEGTATLTQPLYTGGTNMNQLDAAKEREKAARFDLSGSADDVALRAARAHLNLMRTYDLLDIARKYMDAIQGRKDSISLMVREGAGDESDLLQANEILMAAKTTRLGYEEAFRQAEADYIATVGASPGRVLEFGAPTWDRMIPASIDEAISTAVGNNPGIKSANAMVQALGKDAAAFRGTMIPRVDAEVSGIDQQKETELGGSLRNVQGMLKLSWNFSTGGGQFAHLDKDLAARREAMAKLDDARRNVEHDVRQRYTSMGIVDSQYGLSRDREKADEQILSNLTAQFEGGRQSNLQLINANARLFEARAARTDTYYRRLLARFELLSAMGSLREAFAPSAAAMSAKTASSAPMETTGIISKPETASGSQAP
jgi:TolC family type I secretion outer membrane protein